MKQFLRIAKARLKKRFPFKRQRDAVAAKMYVDWIERKENPFGDHFDINRNSAKEKTEQ